MQSLFAFLFFGLLAIGQSSNPPEFGSRYIATGFVHLPYPELREPFVSYYDGVLNRSRIDYYDSLMVTLQKSPAAEKNQPDSEFGNYYKIIWIGDALGNSKRVCFKNGGSEDHHVTGQTVLPNLKNDYLRIGIVECPENVDKLKNSMGSENWNGKHKKSQCELWRKKVHDGQKTSTYSFWILYDKNNKPHPVKYEMSGFNNLFEFGRFHFDHYIVYYTSFHEFDELSDKLFETKGDFEQCKPFPDSDENKNRKLLFNPMIGYFNENRNVYDEHFDEFKNNHNKTYKNVLEHEERKKKFLDNSRFIDSMNRKNQSFKLKINHLADKSETELKILRGRKILKSKYNGGLPFKPKSNSTLPSNWDWRLLGAVNPVKDQAICGSCWSFGVVGSLEGTYFVKTGRLVRLSEQQLVDCSWDQGNNGCDGGIDSNSYKYIMKSGGLATEEDYGHYLGVDGRCHANDVERTVQITNFTNVTQYSIEDLKRALYENGPITIAINVGVRTFAFYSNGIYDDPACIGDPEHLNHQVLLVGYGTLGGKDFWIVKNSWSSWWGNAGYILIAQKDNICGVTTEATYPLIKA